MKFGFIVTTGDPRTAADLAAEVEAAGWDGAFYWDGIAIGEMEAYDPWVVMAGMALRTERVRLGAIVTPPSRRRPWKLARETMTLDRLSGGRLVFPVGLGALDDGAFGNMRYDGIVTQRDRPEDIRAIAEYIARERPARLDDPPFEIVVQGRTSPDDADAAAVVRPFAEVGATWWIDADWEGPTVESLRRRIQAGPPRVP